MKKIILSSLFFVLGVAQADTAFNTFVTAQSAASTLAGTELLPCIQSGSTAKCTPAQFATYLSSNPPSGFVTLTGTQTLTNKSIVATQLTGALQAAQFPALTGDVTTTAGSLATTIANLAVTNAKIAAATIDLTAKVTGTLPAANGGTGSASYTKGDLLCASGSTTLTKLGVGTDTNVLTADSTQTCGIKWAVAPGGGSGSPGGAGFTVQYNNAGSFGGVGPGTTTTLLHGGVGVAPSYSAVSLTADVTGVLPAANVGTISLSTGVNGTLQAGQFPALTGDVTSTAGSLATTIANLAVTNAKIAAATIDLTAKVTGILPGANGGTNNAFMSFTGPASTAKTYTLPNATATILTDNAAVTAAQGGTGNSSYTKGDLLCASGSTTLTKLGVGTNTNVLTADSTQTCGVKWGAAGSGSPAGSSFSTQYNNAGSFGGVGPGTTGQFYMGNTGAAPSWNSGLDITGLPAATALASGDLFLEYSAADTQSEKATLTQVATAVLGNGFLTFAGPATSLKTFTLPNASANILTDNALVTTAQGGTGNAFFAVSGPTTSAKTYTFPNASTTVLTTNAAVTVAQGGTGAATLTGVVHASGTSAMTASAVDLTADITGVLQSANGGTGNAFVNLTGATTTVKTYTLPNASATILTSNALVTAAQGGTANGFFTVAGPASSAKTYTFPNASANVLTDNALVSVAQGGTGAGTLTGVVHGTGTSALTASAVSLTADVSGILPVANGGTNNAFFTISGPATSAKTYTVPNASANILTDNAAVTVAQGGTGLTTAWARTAYAAAAECNNATANPAWNLPTSLQPTAACIGTSNTTATLDFADAVTDTATLNALRLPTGYTGNIDVDIEYTGSASSTNAFVIGLATSCVADGADTIAPTYNTQATSTTAGPATAGLRKTTTFSAITATGCAAGSTLNLQLQRLGANGSDTNTGTFRFLGANITIRVTPQS